MRLPQISGKELIKKLSKTGFVAVRRRGSHVRMEKQLSDKIIKLTVPLHPLLKKGTLHHILKDAGISEDEFEKL